MPGDYKKHFLAWPLGYHLAFCAALPSACSSNPSGESEDSNPDSSTAANDSTTESGSESEDDGEEASSSNEASESETSTSTSNSESSNSDESDGSSTTDDSTTSSTTTTSGSDSDTDTDAKPCANGAQLQILAAKPLYSWPGTVFSDEPLTGQGENHHPQRLVVQVSVAGEPLADCAVHWQSDTGHGWAFASRETTDNDGQLYAYWTAGDPGVNTLQAYIDLENGSRSEVIFNGTVADHQSRTDSVHLHYDVDSSYTEFKIRITPKTGPAATYYSALNWRDSYAGLQFVDEGETMVIFSVWDAGGEDAKIVDSGACNELVGFDGEGTGTSCRFRFPPSAHGAVAGLPDDYQLKVGDTYELHLISTDSESGGSSHSINFYDITRNLGPISLGTQTTGTPFSGGGHASGFVEEWVEHGSCLSNARSVEYHDLKAKVDEEWIDIKSASFSPNYLASNNEICANYLAEVRDGRFFMSSGGSTEVGRPSVPGDDNFPDPQPPLHLP